MQLALILAAWSLFGSGPQAEQHLTFTTSAAPQVRIVTSNGKIDVTTSPGSRVSVKVTKRADTLEAVRALDVSAQQQGNTISLRAIYPKGCGGTCGGEISFAVVVPPGTTLDLGTSNGGINATGISGDARLQSSNGAVTASYAAFAKVKRVSLSTSNGNASLTLPSSAKIGRLKMETSVGRVTSDWPVRVDHSNFVGGSVDQTLVAGAASVTLTTTNGSVTLKKN